MICKICGNSYLRINSFHLKKHGIKNEAEYLELYPNAEIFSDECRKKISETTTEAMKNISDDTRHRMGRKTAKHKAALSASVKQAHVDGKFEKIYTEERNKKISEAKIEYWKTADKSVLWGDYIGSERHLKNSMKHLELATKASMTVKKSDIEYEFEELLIQEGVNFIDQFKLGRFYFDFFLPDTNTLVEIDGEFFHPLTEEECQYAVQKHNYFRDKRKTKFALDAGYFLTRIRI